MGLDWNDTRIGRWLTALYKRNQNTLKMLSIVLPIIVAICTLVAMIF